MHHPAIHTPLITHTLHVASLYSLSNHSVSVLFHHTPSGLLTLFCTSPSPYRIIQCTAPSPQKTNTNSTCREVPLGTTLVTCTNHTTPHHTSVSVSISFNKSPNYCSSPSTGFAITHFCCITDQYSTLIYSTRQFHT